MHPIAQTLVRTTTTTRLSDIAKQLQLAGKALMFGLFSFVLLLFERYLDGNMQKLL
jgi:hypothetical protein